MMHHLATCERMTCLAALFVWIAAGCSAGPPTPPTNLIQVRGTVSRNGEPVPGTIVLFVPVKDGSTRAKGITDQRGRYRLIHESDAPGAEAGEYKVIFQTLRAQAAFADGAPRGTAYGDPETTPYRALVSPDAATFDFDLSRDDGA